MSKIRPAHLSQLYSTKRHSLAPRTVLHIHRILEVAVKWEMIARNPADAVDTPKTDKAEIHPLSLPQVKAFLDEAQNDRYHTLFVLAVTTGMRQGELFALKWQDIDLKNGLVTIKHTLNRATLSLAPVKSKASRRTIRLSKKALDSLKEHRKTQLKKRVGADEWDDRDFVFTAGSGAPLRTEHLVRRHYQPILAKAGLPRISFHNLRHTAATLLLSQGEHPKIVQQLLGHSSVTLTLDTYSHVTPDMLSKTADTMDALLAKERAIPYAAG